MSQRYDIPPADLDAIQSLLDQGKLWDVEAYCGALRTLLDMRAAATRMTGWRTGHDLMAEALRADPPIDDGKLTGVTKTPDGVTVEPPLIMDDVAPDCDNCGFAVEKVDGGWRHRMSGLVACHPHHPDPIARTWLATPQSEA